MTPTQRYRRSPKGLATRKRYREGRGKITDRIIAWRRQGIDITYERYLAMIEECQNTCPLCTDEENVARRLVTGIKGTLVVDHDHVTGKVRGLLCNHCNMKLDWAIPRIPNILQYLHR